MSKATNTVGVKNLNENAEKMKEPVRLRHSCGSKIRPDRLYGDSPFPRHKKFTHKEVANEGYCTETKKMPDGSREFCCFYPRANNYKNLCDGHYDDLVDREEERKQRQIEYEEEKQARAERKVAFEERERKRQEWAAAHGENIASNAAPAVAADVTKTSKQ